MNITKMEITPDLARAWLSTQHPNRPINRSHVKSLAGVISQGHWEVTHQGIAFDNSNRLVDGQHRLCAVIMADQPVFMMVAFGVDVGVALRGVDRSKPRSAAQSLQLSGIKDTAVKAAICRSLNLFIDPTFGYTSSLSTRSIEQIYTEYKDAIEWAAYLNFQGFTSAVKSVFAMLYDHSDLKTWAERATDGIGLGAGDSRLALRATFVGPVKSGSLEMVIRLLKTVTAVDAYMNSERVTKIQISSMRYARFCKMIGKEPNRSLLAVCG